MSNLNDEITKYGKPPLDAAYGLYDSLFPVVYCNYDLIITDLNEAATHVEMPLRGESLEKYLSEDDASNIRALLNSKTISKKGELSVIAKIIHTHCFSYALVVARSLFGVEFAEIRLFRSKKEMFSSYQSASLIFPVEAKIPEYVLTDPHRGYPPAARELNELFAFNLFSKLYTSALAGKEKPDLYDSALFSKRVLTELCAAMTPNRAKWNITLRPGEHKPCFPAVNKRNFVNMMAIAFVVFSSVSEKKECAADIVPRGKETDIILRTKAKKTSSIFFGEFVFPLVGEMYPECYALTKAYVFLCDLFGVPCYCDLSEDGILSLRTVLSEEKVHISFDVSHEEKFDKGWFDAARGLISILGGDEI